MTMQPKTFPAFRPFASLSPRTCEAHYKLYTGYVQAYNTLCRKYASNQRIAGPFGHADGQSVKIDMLGALASIKNHELYFDTFAAEPAQPIPETLAQAITADFGDASSYLRDLRDTCARSTGWAWTVLDRDQSRLLNIASGPQNPFPIWNTTPLLAIDLFGHAYLYDYGNDKLAYIDACIQHIDWAKCAGRLTQITVPAS
jgi:superoxide dismutase, Fe-Mn family